MTIPSLTPSKFSRVVSGSLLSALLATAAIALTGAGAGAAAPAQAGPPPDGPRTYQVTADLDGRTTPSKKGHVAAVNLTLYVPDRFIKTGTSGRAPDIRACDSDDNSDTDPGPNGDS